MNELTKESMKQSGMVGPGSRIDEFYAAARRFVALIRADERETCAMLCEQPVDEIQITDDCKEMIYMDGKECAQAIRSRKVTE